MIVAQASRTRRLIPGGGHADLAVSLMATRPFNFTAASTMDRQIDSTSFRESAIPVSKAASIISGDGSMDTLTKSVVSPMMGVLSPRKAPEIEVGKHMQKMQTYSKEEA